MLTEKPKLEPQPRGRRGRFLVWMGVWLCFMVGGWVAVRGKLPQGPISGENDKFLKEYAFLLHSGTKFSKEDQKRYESLEQAWALPTVGEQERQQVVELTQGMMRHARYNKSYLWLWHDVLVHYLGQDSLQKEWTRFKELLEVGLARERSNTREQTDFLHHLVAFFHHGQLGVTRAFEWSVSQWDDFELVKSPELGYRFKGIDLTCSSLRDTMTIQGTSGTYYPFTKQWDGKGGKVGWERSATPLEQAYATLSGYEIAMLRDQYHADSVMLYYPEYFEGEVLGKLFNRLAPYEDSASMTVPEFTSYAQTHRLRNLMEGVDFEGGCVVQGARLVGVGTPFKPVRFLMSREGKPFLKVNTERMAFRFNPEEVAADDAEVTIYLDKDSLYHHGLRFEYNNNLKRMVIQSTDKMTTKAPIYSSFHGLNVYCDALSWREGDSVLTIGPKIGSQQEGKAFFMSSNYFDQEEFDQMMGLDNFHPVLSLWRYSQSIGGATEFDLGGYASFIRKPSQGLVPIMMSLVVEGLIRYDEKTKMIQLLPRLSSMVESRAGREDFDVIRFSSTTEKGQPNATVNLKTFDLEVNNVSPIQVSKTSNVQLRPEGNFVRLGNDRNVEFDGAVDVGLFHFEGDSMMFNYETFSIDMKNVRSLSMEYQMEEREYTGQRRRGLVQSVITNLTGQVFIDAPGNKSGAHPTGEYPYFESTQPARVTYDAPNIHGGAYKKDSFYFEVAPFVFHNLSNYEPKDLRFAGMMYPGKVLEPFEETLVLRPDKSLGFVHPVPAEGLPIYGNRGVFYNNLDLSNSGLRGAGKITYLNSTTHSEQFNFFSDSMTAVSTRFAIAEQGGAVEYPPVEGKQFGIQWYPSREEFNASTIEEPFSLYSKEASLKGTLSVQPDGLEGRGNLDMRKGFMESESFFFKQRWWRADSMNLALRGSASLDSVIFRASRVGGSVNYETRLGEFVGAGGKAMATTFSALQYGAYMDQLHWPIDSGTLLLRTDGVQRVWEQGEFVAPRMHPVDSVPLPGSIFYSIAPKEDSLYFQGEVARFSLASGELTVDSVPYLLVADAVVELAEGGVQVHPETRLQPLDSVTIQVGTPKLYHRVYDAWVDVGGGNAYAGRGMVNYVDRHDSVTPLHLDTMYVMRDAKGVHYTHGVADIPWGDSILLSPQFAFSGKVGLDGFSPHFDFKGGVKPLTRCPVPTGYARFHARLNPDSILIPVVPPVGGLDSSMLMVGTVMAYDSVHLYPALLTPRVSYADVSMLMPKGFLHYAPLEKQFIFEDSILRKRKDTMAHRFTVSESTCEAVSEGRLTLPFKLGRPQVKSVGKITHQIEAHSVLMQLFMELDFFCQDEFIDAITQSIMGNAELTSVNLKQELFFQVLRDRCDTTTCNKVRDEIELFGQINEPLKVFGSTFTLGEMTMRWDQDNRSLVSVGSLGITAIKGKPVYKRVNGYFEIFRRYTGDWFTLYLEPTPGEYYLFYLTGNSLYVVSSNQLLLKAINDMKSKKRTLKASDGFSDFTYSVGTVEQVQQVQKRYQQVRNYQF